MDKNPDSVRFTKKSTPIIIVAASIFLSGFFVVNFTHAATINVPTDQPTIQAAIDAAISGDTINVAAGTYTENLTILTGKTNLNLSGAGLETTTIKGVQNINIASNVDNIGQQPTGEQPHNQVAGEQTFQVDTTTTIYQVQFWALAYGSPQTLVASLKETQGGEALATASSNNIAGTLTQYLWTFDTPTTLSPNSPYRIEWSCVGNCNNSNFFQVGIDITNPYSNGAYSEYDGSTWTELPILDANLQIFGTTTESAVNNPVLTISPLTMGIKIHGFTIEGPDYTGGHSSNMVISGPNIEIYDNAFKVTPAANPDEISQAIQTRHKNDMPNVDLSGLNIHNNTFTHLSDGAAGYEGIWINLDAGVGLATIQNNQFTGNVFRAITTERSSTTISGNTITTDLEPGDPGLGGWQGINIGGANAGTSTISNISVANNTIQGSAVGKGFSYGIKLGYNAGATFDSVSIGNNAIHNSGTAGIWTEITASGITLSNNDLSNNSLGIKNDDAVATLIATLNWWGSNINPIDMTIGNVNVNPWCKNSSCSSLNFGTSSAGVATSSQMISVITTSTAGTIQTEIPASTTITGGVGWDGTLALPTITTSFTLTPDSGNTASAVEAIEIGAGDTPLMLDQAVKLTFAGQAGKLVGWSRGGTFTQITAACDNLTPPTLSDGADCKIDSGFDLIVWAKHLTTFITYTQTPIPPAPAVLGGGGGGGGGSFSPAYPLIGVVSPAVQTPTTTPASAGQVLGAVTFNFTSDLKLGMSGDAVTEFQKRLTSEGVYSGPITGYFGQMTLAGAKAYQKKYGVSQTGFVGPLTRAQLNGSQVAGISTSTIDITAIQTQIASLQAQVNVLLQQLKMLQSQ